LSELKGNLDGVGG